MNDDDDIEGLAAEYALGSLDIVERRAVEARRSRDPALASAIADWEHRLGSLNDRIPPIAPPAEVRARVLESIDRAAAGALVDKAGTPSESATPADGPFEPGGSNPSAIVLSEITELRSRIRRLRVTNWLSMGIAASFALLLGWGAATRNGPNDLLVTALMPDRPSNSADEGPASAAATFVLIANPRTGRLALQLAAGRVPEGRVYQLWMRPATGGPLTAISRIHPGESRIKSTTTPGAIAENRNVQFLVSIEPITDTPPPVPTGRILATGRFPGSV